MSEQNDKPYLGLQLPRDMYYDLKEQAEKEHMSIKKLARLWIAERLDYCKQEAERLRLKAINAAAQR